MSVSNILIPLLGMAIVIFFVFQQRKRLKTVLASSTEYTAGAIATRLGLHLVEGDANLNFLYLMQPGGDNEYGEYERRVRLVGTPYGRNVEFFFGDGRTVSKDAYNLLLKREAILHYQCRLSMALPVTVAPFEVTFRNPNEYLRPLCSLTGRQGFPDVSLGNPQLDAMFRLAAADPRVGPAIANALSGLTHQQFVHVHAHDGQLEMFVTRTALPCVVHAVEEYLLALETIACVLEGRPAPAQLAPAQQRAA
jgi:hypothetical protein